MFRSMFTVGGFTLISRVLGLVRDKLIIYFLGAGAMGDVWVAAFALPNLFRRVFGEGAFNSAFVPLYCRKIEEEGDAAANYFASRTITLMFWMLLSIFVVMFIFMNQIIRVTNMGFTGDERFGMAVVASRITIGYMIFVCLMAAYSGILNSRKCFGPPSFAYVVLNIVLILVMVIGTRFFENSLYLLSYGVIIAGVLQLAVVVSATFRRKIKVGLVFPEVDQDVRKLGILMIPGLISAGVQQLNLLVGGTVASLDVGGRSAIYLSDRINQLPLGIIGMAAGVVLLPEISRNLRAGKSDEAKRSLAMGAEMTLLLCIPALVVLLVIPEYIMYSIFQGGKVSGAEAGAVGKVLAAFAVGMPAYVLAKVYQPGYYAREDTRTPMKFAIVAAVVNMALCYPLYLWMGVAGCALATSIAGWFNLVLLWLGLRKDNFVSIDRRAVWRYLRMGFAAVLMSGAIWYLAGLTEPLLHLEKGMVGYAIRLTVLFLLVLVGIVLYLGLVFAFRVFSIGEVKRILKRNRSV